MAEAMHIKRASDIIDEICHAVSMWPTITKRYQMFLQVWLQILTRLYYIVAIKFNRGYFNK